MDNLETREKADDLTLDIEKLEERIAPGLIGLPSASVCLDVELRVGIGHDGCKEEDPCKQEDPCKEDTNNQPQA